MVMPCEWQKGHIPDATAAGAGAGAATAAVGLPSTQPACPAALAHVLPQYGCPGLSGLLGTPWEWQKGHMPAAALVGAEAAGRGAGPAGGLQPNPQFYVFACEGREAGGGAHLPRLWV